MEREAVVDAEAAHRQEHVHLRLDRLAGHTLQDGLLLPVQVLAIGVSAIASRRKAVGARQEAQRPGVRAHVAEGEPHGQGLAAPELPILVVVVPADVALGASPRWLGEQLRGPELDASRPRHARGPSPYGRVRDEREDGVIGQVGLVDLLDLHVAAHVPAPPRRHAGLVLAGGHRVATRQHTRDQRVRHHHLGDDEKAALPIALGRVGGSIVRHCWGSSKGAEQGVR
jgi:hypothetical protein